MGTKIRNTTPTDLELAASEAGPPAPGHAVVWLGCSRGLLRLDPAALSVPAVVGSLAVLLLPFALGRRSERLRGCLRWCRLRGAVTVVRRCPAGLVLEELGGDVDVELGRVGRVLRCSSCAAAARSCTVLSSRAVAVVGHVRLRGRAEGEPSRDLGKGRRGREECEASGAGCTGQAGAGYN